MGETQRRGAPSRWKDVASGGGIILGAGAVVGLSIAFAPAIAEWLVGDAVVTGTQSEVVDRTALDARIFVVQTGLRIGLGVLGLLAVWLSYRRIRAMETQAEVAVSGDQTDRYARAVEQLGNKAAAIRIGGVYALEALASDAPSRFAVTVRDVLQAFVQDDDQEDLNEPEARAQPQPAADREAALQVLGRLGLRVSLRGVQARGFDLHGVNLSNADLNGANLSEADLQAADLRGAELRRADLRAAKLSGAKLQGAMLWEADLRQSDAQSADFVRADLKAANLQEADFTQANLWSADLSWAQVANTSLDGANLKEANLREADLEAAILTQAALQNAVLTRSNLSETNLWNANLRFAVLTEAKLRGARFDEANLMGAIFDGATGLETATGLDRGDDAT